MRLHILPATVGRTPGQALSGYVVDGVIALDAGALGFSGTIEEQEQIRHVFLTHSHIDHVAGLPMFLDNRYGSAEPCPTVYGLLPTLASLRSDLFNHRLMPDFIGMSARMSPFLALEELTTGEAVLAGPYTVTPIAVEHTVPTVGYIVDDGKTAFGLLTDTRPVPNVIQAILAHPRLRAIMLECSFPRRLQTLAEASDHHSTNDFLKAALAIPNNVPVYPIHMKPRFHDEIVKELTAAGVSNLRFVEPGDTVEI